MDTNTDTDSRVANVTAKDTWIRGLYMLFFAVVYSVTEIVLALIVIFQFIHLLFTRDVNGRLTTFSHELAAFIYQILQFVTFNTDDKPYPFAAWPEDGAMTDPAEDMPPVVAPVNAANASADTGPEAPAETGQSAKSKGAKKTAAAKPAAADPVKGESSESESTGTESTEPKPDA